MNTTTQSPSEPRASARAVTTDKFHHIETLHRPTRLLVFALVFLPLAACTLNEQPTPPPTPPLHTTATSGPATLTVTLDRATMRTVDHATLTIELTLAPNHTGKIDPPDLEAWTLINHSQTPLRIGNAGRAHLTTRITIEPFLPAELAIPPIHAGWHSLDTDATGVVSTEPLAVVITSVLKTNDTLELEPPLPLAEAPEQSVQTPRYALFVIPLSLFAAVSAVALLAYLRFRKPTAPPTPSLQQQLHALSATAPELDAPTIYDQLHSILASPSTPPRGTGVPTVWTTPSPLLTRIERARFTPTTPTRDQALADLAAALDLAGAGA